MHRTLAATAVAALLITLPAFAQVHPHIGWSLGLNAHLATTATHFGGAGISATMGATSHNASLQAAYGLPLGDKGMLGLGMTVGVGDLEGGSMRLAGTGLSFKTRDMYSVYIEPGHVLAASTLLYAKLAYLGARGEESYGGATFSKTFAGVGYGVGSRTMLSRHLYLQFEFLQSDYEWKTARTGAFRPVSTTGTIGLGYKF